MRRTALYSETTPQNGLILNQQLIIIHQTTIATTKEKRSEINDEFYIIITAGIQSRL